LKNSIGVSPPGFFYPIYPRLETGKPKTASPKYKWTQTKESSRKVWSFFPKDQERSQTWCYISVILATQEAKVGRQFKASTGKNRKIPSQKHKRKGLRHGSSNRVLV
jgi:hypothetical protein